MHKYDANDKKEKLQYYNTQLVNDSLKVFPSIYQP